MTLHEFAPAGKDRVFTKRRRLEVAEFSMRLTMVECPFRDQASYEWLGDDIFGAVSWVVDMYASDGTPVSSQELHALPLLTGEYLADTADATMHIPHWALFDAMGGDRPRSQLARKLAREPAEGDMFLLVEHLIMSDQWRRLGIEPLLMGAAIRRLMGFHQPLFALGQPSLPFWKGRTAERTIVVNQTAFHTLAFRRFASTPTWVAVDMAAVARSCDRVRAQFHLPANPFE